MTSMNRTAGGRMKSASGPGKGGTPRFRLPDGTRSVQSPFVWRGFFFMSLIALGLCITFVSEGKSFYAIAWGMVTAGWFGISMWLWRRHVADDDERYNAARKSGGKKR